MSTPIHLLNLGVEVDEGVLNALLKSNGKSELVSGILQKIRDTALDSATSAAEGIDGKNDALIHAKLGRYDGLAELLRDLHSKTRPSETAKEREDDLLSEVPRV